MNRDYLFDVVIGVSNRHVHVSKEALEQLFGAGYELTELKDLGQPGQFACVETVTLVGNKGKIDNVRILGPIRRKTQVEISRADSFKLGIKAVLRDSGEHDNTPGCTLIGPKGEITIDSGVMVAARHIHITPEMAEQYGLKNKDHVSAIVEGQRATVFNNVLVRVREDYALEFHLDVDEANGAWVNNGDKAKIIKEK
ncbi:MAG: phosphate propanoyltransferase [Bacillota bacterium]